MRPAGIVGPYYCRTCAHFTGGPLAECRACGTVGERWDPHTADPPRWRDHRKAKETLRALNRGRTYGRR